MYYKELKVLCDSEGWNVEHILVQLELEEAKKCSINMARGQQHLKELDGLVSDNVIARLKDWIHQQDERRLEHMLHALDMAQVSSGLGDGWNKHLEQIWQKDGSKLPHI